MKIGNKDKISQFVDFRYSYGNEAVLGFQNNSISDICFPITLIPRNIEEFSSKKYKVIFVFCKSGTETIYKTPIMEIKTGILSEHYYSFPEELRQLVQQP
jgi:predicted nucleotide-binding protein (sugar kinase/HSP70/actin superfamily)